MNVERGDSFKGYSGAGSAGLGDWLEVAGENPLSTLTAPSPPNSYSVIPCLLPMLPSVLRTKLRFLGKEVPVSHARQLEC